MWTFSRAFSWIAWKYAVVVASCCLTLALSGEDRWTAGTVPSSVSFTVSGMIDLDRSATEMLLPTSNRLVATNVVPQGTVVTMGDPIIQFDASREIRRVGERQHDVAVAQAEKQLRELRIDIDRKNLADRRLEALGDLAVARAAYQRACQVDVEAFALAQAELTRAKGNASARERQLEKKQRAQRAGEITDDEFAQAVQAVSVAQGAVRVAEAEVAKAGLPATELEQQRLALNVQRLLVTLGIDESDQPISGAGITGEMEGLEARHKRDRRQAAEYFDRVQRDLHDSVRNAWDHTPLRELTIGDQVYRFAPESVSVPDGAIRCGGEPYTPERGWGFIGASADQLDVVTRPSRRGGNDGCLIIRGSATFRVDKVNGTYDLQWILGDDRDWDGAVIRVIDNAGSRVLASPRRIEPRDLLKGSTTIVVENGYVEIQCGDDLEKALRSPRAGIALPRDFVRPGWRSGWSKDPSAYIAGPGSLRIRSVVSQELSRVLREPIPGEPAEELRDRLATASALWMLPDGQQGHAQVVNVVRIAVPLSLRSDAVDDGPLDRLGNEVFWSLPAQADPSALRIGTHVSVQVDVPVPSGCSVIPMHMLGVSGSRSYIQHVGQSPQVCQAVVIEGLVIINQELAPGTQLQSVDLDVADAEETRFPGEIVAGTSIPIISPTASGRIAELIPDGTDVIADQIVVTLYNPWIEERRDDNIRNKEQAEAAYAESAESRRLAAERSAVEHRTQAVAEREASVAVAAAREVSQNAILKAQIELESIKARVGLAEDILQRAQALGDPRRLEIAQHNAQQAGIDRQQAELALVLAERSVNWLSIQSAELDWKDLLSDLGSRELAVQRARLQEKASALDAEIRLARALDGSNWERAFEQGKFMRAPQAGRVFYRKGWDDQSSKNATFQKDFWVWRGMTVADVLDIRQLAFRVDIPESRIMDLAVGQSVIVVLTRFDQRKIPATIKSIGQAVVGAADDDGLGVERRLGLRRVVSVTCDFAVPDDLHGRLLPGVKGELELP